MIVEKVTKIGPKGKVSIEKDSIWTDGKQDVTVIKIDENFEGTFIYTDKLTYGSKIFLSKFTKKKENESN